MRFYENTPALKSVLDSVAGGQFSPDEPGRYRPLVDSLLWVVTITCCWPTMGLASRHNRELMIFTVHLQDGARRPSPMSPAWAYSPLIEPSANTRGKSDMVGQRCLDDILGTIDVGLDALHRIVFGGRNLLEGRGMHHIVDPAWPASAVGVTDIATK